MMLAIQSSTPPWPDSAEGAAEVQQPNMPHPLRNRTLVLVGQCCATLPRSNCIATSSRLPVVIRRVRYSCCESTCGLMVSMLVEAHLAMRSVMLLI